jgi:membrane-associated phospholipid phosphatase
MKKYITDEKNGLDYTLVGDVYLPNLISTETNYEIGMWGQRHLRYIKQHRKVFYTSLLTNCKLNTYLYEVDVRAIEMYDRLVKQLKEQQGITEQLKADDMLAWVLLVVGYFMAVYYSNSYNGKSVREMFNYTAGDSPALLSVLCWGFWAVLYAWVPVVCYFLLDDIDPDKLIAVGAAILIAGIVADNVNAWLKQVASRPRYKYLITLENPRSEYRDWWQMVPNLAGNDDNYKSWPSGNMTIATMMFSLPMLADVCKKKNMTENIICFVIACAFVLLYGYNRIHMTNHFLTDVCFGTLFTYLIYSVCSTAFLNYIR